ncbi:MAG: hypothetical protein IKS08_01160 [Alphaproteobacteria bacterium]|nr:hypothetical protein [Alphaproteobacteria bacterium]
MSRKVPNKVGKILMLAGLMALTKACKKPPIPEPNPNPNQPTTIIPTKEVTIVWDWSAGVGRAPPVDSVRYYTDQDSVKHVYIHLIGEHGIGYPVNCTGFDPDVFFRSRIKLQQCIDVDSTEVSLLGSFYVIHTNAPNHEPGQGPGITPYDKEWFERHGITFVTSVKNR